MNGVATGWHLCCVQQFRRSQGGHIKNIVQSLDVSEEAHASISSVGFRHKSPVEANDDRQAQHYPLQGSSNSLSLHRTISILDHHGKFRLI